MDLGIKELIDTMLPILNERQRRLFLAKQASVLGYGGITKVSDYTGVSRQTITSGIKELNKKNSNFTDTDRSRRPGGGRKNIRDHYPEIVKAITGLIEGYTKGDPENTLLWTSKSVRNIKAALDMQGIKISHTRIGSELKEAGYSLQANRKELAKTPCHADRNAQFEYINRRTKRAMKGGKAVLSIDAKKKENIGKFKNTGKEYAGKGKGVLVYDHDFLEKTLGKATPYGIYDLFRNAGFVNVGLSGDTSEFAVSSIKKWWMLVGKKEYAEADEIVITADCGGSNGYRVRLWKYCLQILANKIGKKITVLHFPPGTSKWNKIEHRLFSFIRKNWRGKPLISAAVIVNLIGSTRTNSGLRVKCVLDETEYKKSRKISDSEFESINIKEHKFHGEWNYTISPKST
jgi:transposase